ncbi:MAG: MMPL family transporter [Kiritimatiellia bacterium]
MKALAKGLFLLALASAGMVAAVGLRCGVETDIFSLAGDAAFRNSPLALLHEVSADSVRVLCADGARADALRARYPFDAPLDPAAFLETVRTHGLGLLAPKTRELLARNETDRIRRSVRRRDYSGVGLFPKADDPYYFLNDFVMALQALEPEGLADGAVILTGRGSMIDAAVPGGGLLALIREAEADDGLWLSGTPFHTVLARRQTVREINVLGFLSLAAVLLFGWLLFRSFRFAVPMTLLLGAGFLAATGAVCLLPGLPHALTFLFGTTLIGLGVDYCFHALSAERFEADFGRKLTGALVTSCLAFAPLLLSRVCVLRQMAAFSIVGMVTIYAGVRLFMCPVSGRMEGSGTRSFAFARFRGLRPSVLFGLFLILAALFVTRCVVRAPVSSDPSLFHRPVPVMARGEAKFAELTGTSARVRLVNVTEWQRQNAELKKRMCGDATCLTSDAPCAAHAVPGAPFLTAADFPSGMAFRWKDADYLVLPEEAAQAIVGDFGESVSPKGSLELVFARFLVEAMMMFGGAMVLLCLVAFVMGYGLGLVLRPFGACILTFLTIGLVAGPLTFFHILCFFIIFGLGIDYSIFHVQSQESRGDSSPESGDHALKKSRNSVVFISFLTSFVSFGLLAFTSFPVTRGMGLTMAVGLFWAYVLSMVRGGPAIPRNGDRPRAPSTRLWHIQKEQSAGWFRIRLMWFFYRFLGKDVAKILFIPGYLFIYPFCTSARAALRRYYGILGVEDRSFRHLLGFAWSMLDKTDACTLGKNPPRLELAGDTDWMKGGCFLLSAHLGCIGVLPALRGAGCGGHPAPVVHAFQQMGHDAEFTRFFTEHMDVNRLTLHAVEEIGVETAVEMKAAIGRGEIVLMAGDRLPAAPPPPDNGCPAPGVRHRARFFARPFLGRLCHWPKGAFRFAQMMESPIYAIVCVRKGWNTYEVRARRLGTDPLGTYIAFLEENVRRYPYQWYQFYDFFEN